MQQRIILICNKCCIMVVAHNYIESVKGKNMAPRTKCTKEEIVEAAVRITRRKGIDGVTAREIGAELGVSSRPTFTWFESIEQVKAEVYESAKATYKEFVEQGLAGPIPFLGVGKQYIRFAKEEPELYKLIFLTKWDKTRGGAMEALEFSQDLVRESLMRIYNMDAHTADCYFRDLWLVVFSFATLIVTEDCPYSEEEMSRILTEVSLSVCKAYKEVPGLVEGTFDKDAVFMELVKK